VYILLLASCNSISKGNSEKLIKNGNTREIFSMFYEKFNEDSIFQKQRIKFPLPGFDSEKNYSNPLDSNSIKNVNGEMVNTYWRKGDWKIHHALTDTSYKVQVEKNDSVVKETIFIPDSDFKIERKFEIVDNKWYLVYYAD
jgi:hypothetical protein